MLWCGVCSGPTCWPPWCVVSKFCECLSDVSSHCYQQLALGVIPFKVDDEGRAQVKEDITHEQQGQEEEGQEDFSNSEKK